MGFDFSLPNRGSEQVDTKIDIKADTHQTIQQMTRQAAS